MRAVVVQEDETLECAGRRQVERAVKSRFVIRDS